MEEIDRNCVTAFFIGLFVVAHSVKHNAEYEGFCNTEYTIFWLVVLRYIPENL